MKSPATLPARSRAAGVRQRSGGAVDRQDQLRVDGIRAALEPLAAALMFVTLVVVGVAYLDLRQDNKQLRAEVRELQEGSRAGGSLAVEAVRSTNLAPQAGGTVVLDVYNLPQHTGRHSYQICLVDREGRPVSLGEMELNARGDGRMVGDTESPLNFYEAIEITSEPAGGSGKTGPVYLQARF